MCHEPFVPAPRFFGYCQSTGSVARTWPVSLRPALTAWLLLLLASTAAAAVNGPPMTPYEDRADDRARKHAEQVESSPASYTIDFRGTIDGTMTRMPIGYAAAEHGWQPNRAVKIENVGEADVVNPRLVVGNGGDWRSVESMAASDSRGYQSAALRARAIWEAQRRRRFHATTWDNECSDAVKAACVYGYTLCGNEARVIADLWRAAGFTTRRGHPVGHCVTEVQYDGAFHLLDSDEHVLCLKRDNRSIASAADVVRDHDLMKRTHTYSILAPENRRTDEFSASLYSYQGSREDDWPVNSSHNMNLVLRPGESIEYRFDHIGKQYSAGAVPKPGENPRDGIGSLLARWGRAAYDSIRNGKLRYEPDLRNPVFRRGAALAERVRFDTATGSFGPVEADQAARIRWRFSSPYVFVGGKASATVRLAQGASATWRWTNDAANDAAWINVASHTAPGTSTLAAVLDEHLSPRGRPCYEFWLEIVLQGDASVEQLAFEHDVQMSMLGLPELHVGRNLVKYVDDTQGGRVVRITHRWLERTAWHPPEAPATAEFPADGQTIEGTRPTFCWSAASDPDGDEIVDYHFELSEFEDMRWPLSPNFERLISRTPSKGKCEWRVPYVGLLNPQTTYYWRVRARDATGVWGRWSRTFRCRADAPGVPLDLRLEPQGECGLILTWRPSSAGRPPVAYRIYGSDEKGFTASDEPYEVFRGKGFVRTMEEYESIPDDAPGTGTVTVSGNFIAETDRMSRVVVGPDAPERNANRAFYRVVAVDEAGNRSGPSDYVEVPRPFVYAPPPTRARLRRPFRHQIGIIRSDGDLQCRRSDKSSYNAAFWDREHWTFWPIDMPDGLSLDSTRGTISGKPTRAGRSAIVVQVQDQFGHQKRYRWPLDVGL